MNMVMFYFSGTGNTWWTCAKLKAELEALGNAVEMYSLENPVLQEEGFVADRIAWAEHVIVGFPIYGSDLPANMKTFVADLPKVGDAKKFSAFCTQASFSGDGNIYFKADVEARGYQFRQSFQIDFTTNFNVAMMPFALSKPASGKKLDKIKSKVAAKLKKMAEFISNDVEYFEGRRFYQKFMGGFQRKMFCKQTPKLMKKFQFFPDRCVKCGACVKNCPTQNIEFDMEKMEMIWGENCLLCFRCYNFCPAQAINYGGKINDPEKYQRYPGPVEHLKVDEIRE